MKVYFFIIFILVVPIIGFLTWQRISFKNWLKSGHIRITSFKAKELTPSVDSQPKLLQEYLKKVLPGHNQAVCNYTRFKQRGLFRMNPEDVMTDFKANQIVSLVSPMFSWEANITSKGIPITVCDRLVDGMGELEARLFGLFRVAKATGPELLRGELLRYLAEIPWFPHAAANQSLMSWQQDGDSKLYGTISLGEVSATVEYRLKDGLIESIFVPDRGRSVGGKSIPTPWLGEFKKYKKMGNVLVPTYGEVSWLLDEGKFTYFKGNITDYKVFCQ